MDVLFDACESDQTLEAMTMAERVTIVGGHGQIARHLTTELVGRGYDVRGLVRSSDHFPDVRADGAEPVQCDIEHAGDAEIDVALSGSDVVVFAAGAGPGSGPERKLTVDRDGAARSVESAIRVGAKRFVVVGAMGADQAPPESDQTTFSVYLRAKRDADEAVREASERSGIGYTIVRPGRLTDGS
jgi:nucleoside-diphosphate-sugar epimerase